MGSLGEFVATLTVDTAGGGVTVKELISSFGELEASTLGEIGALATLAGVMGELADHGIALASGFRDFSNQTGLSMRGLERWQIAGGQVGISAEKMAGSIKALQDQLFRTALTGEKFNIFAMLGVDPKNKDAFQVLESIRKRLPSLTPQARSYLLGNLGIDPSMINVLKLSRDEFEKLAGVAKGMTDQQAVGFLQMQEELARTKAQVADFGYSAGLMVKPFVDDLSAIVNYLHESPRALALVSVGVVGLGIAASAAFAPWLLTAFAISAALAGIVLILDDIISYFRTGKSAGQEFGDAMAKMFGKLGIKAEDFLWEHHMMPNLGASFGQPALAGAGAGGGKTITNNIVVHDSSGRPHETVAEEYRRALDHADKMIP
jgi:hypothetical protein